MRPVKQRPASNYNFRNIKEITRPYSQQSSRPLTSKNNQLEGLLQSFISQYPEPSKNIKLSDASAR